MNRLKNKVSFLLITLLIVLGSGAMVWWFVHDPSAGFTISIPGMDNRGKVTAGNAESIKIGEYFTYFKTIPGLPGSNWPRFRGADFDNISKENIPLIDKWEKAGPRILWKIPLGEGHAAPAVYDGRVYLLDYDETKREDALRCFSLLTGDELWRRGYQVRLKRNHGLSRTIPAVNDKYVVSIGPRGQVMCVDRLTGNLRWGLDLAKEFNAQIPFWYTGQCPLIDNDTAILAAGGDALLVAVDCKTGKKVWEAPNLKKWKMSHSSVMPMIFDGRKMYIYCAIGGICGVAATGSDQGKILWETTEFSPSVVAPSPVILDHGHIFMTAGYGAGSALLEIKEENNRFKVTVVQKYKPMEGLASEQQTPILLKGYLYGIQPKDAGGLRNQFVCCKSDNGQTIIMNSGKNDRFGLGPYLYADGKFFILNDDGEMTIAKASPAGFNILDKARIIEGQDSWGPLAITGGYLLMRDSKTLVCLDIRKK
ncbi:MAG: PQQ-binding-like beta-propeller repeat protein [Bacteroidales bacterium]|nr:PQQ-binding-like beta-propeller repeat protein [Bacteroidales bacterium]